MFDGALFRLVCRKQQERINRKKMKRQTVFLRALIAAVALIVLGCSGSDKGDKWILIGTYDSDSVYYDKDNVKPLQGGVVQVWMMTKLSKESVAERINARKNLNLPVEGYDKSSYDLSQVEINCGRRTFKQTVTEEYDDQGKKLSGYAGEMTIRISPGSRGEMIFDKVCQK